MKKDNKIIWIIGIIIILIVVANQPKQEMVELTPHFYKDGVEVFPERGLFGFSIITPPGGSYNQIAFDVVITNVGNVNITNIQIVNASPIEFFNALPTTAQTLAIGESKVLWASDNMSTEQFENMTQPINFWIKVLGTSPKLETIYKEAYSGDISFEGEVDTHYTGEFWDVNFAEENVFISGLATNGNSFWISAPCFWIDPDDYISKYDMSGNFQTKWKIVGEEHCNTWSLTTDGNYIWEYDYNFQDLKKYDMSGNYQSVLRGFGSSTQTYKTYRVATDGMNIYTIDYGGNLYKYDMSGNYQEHIKDLGPGSPTAMTTNGNNIWVLYGGQVNKYDMQGNLGDSWNLDSLNVYPKGMANYGDYIWVLSGGNKLNRPYTNKVFKYQK